MGARLCEQWGTAVCKCPAVYRSTRKNLTMGEIITYADILLQEWVDKIWFQKHYSILWHKISDRGEHAMISCIIFFCLWKLRPGYEFIQCHECLFFNLHKITFVYGNNSKSSVVLNTLPKDRLLTRAVHVSPGRIRATFVFLTGTGIPFIRTTSLQDICSPIGILRIFYQLCKQLCVLFSSG